jgi:anti-sigma regulatory factor (Ser/Thr protein kinase)
MPADCAPFTLTFPSDLRMLAVARSFVEAVCQTCDLDRSTTHAIVLATGEAVSNVIRHAHGACPEMALQIQIRIDADCLQIDVLDEGAPFDISAVPHLDPGEMRVGGRGVYLMRTLMDELTCRPRGPRGNVLRMVKRRLPQSCVRECG